VTPGRKFYIISNYIAKTESITQRRHGVQRLGLKDSPSTFRSDTSPGRSLQFPKLAHTSPGRSAISEGHTSLGRSMCDAAYMYPVYCQNQKNMYKHVRALFSRFIARYQGEHICGFQVCSRSTDQVYTQRTLIPSIPHGYEHIESATWCIEI
jgi:hypothetical protein